MLSCKVECLSEVLDEFGKVVHDDQLLSDLAYAGRDRFIQLLVEKLGFDEDSAEQAYEKYRACVEERCTGMESTITVFADPIRDLCQVLVGSVDRCDRVFEKEMVSKPDLAKYIIEKIIRYYVSANFELDIDFRCEDFRTVVTKDALVVKCDGVPVLKISHSGLEITLLLTSGHAPRGQAS